MPEHSHGHLNFRLHLIQYHTGGELSGSREGSTPAEQTSSGSDTASTFPITSLLTYPRPSTTLQLHMLPTKLLPNLMPSFGDPALLLLSLRKASLVTHLLLPSELGSEGSSNRWQQVELVEESRGKPPSMLS